MESVDSPAPAGCLKSLLCSCGEVLWWKELSDLFITSDRNTHTQWGAHLVNLPWLRWPNVLRPERTLPQKSRPPAPSCRSQTRPETLRGWDREDRNLQNRTGVLLIEKPTFSMLVFAFAAPHIAALCCYLPALLLWAESWGKMNPSLSPTCRFASPAILKYWSNITELPYFSLQTQTNQDATGDLGATAKRMASPTAQRMLINLKVKCWIFYL